MEINTSEILDRFAHKPDRRKRGGGEYQELIGLITDRTNASRKQAGFLPMSYARVAMKLSHLTLAQIRDHYWQADKAENFSRYFWGLLKVKAPSPQP
jgi:hypothetical protein